MNKLVILTAAALVAFSVSANAASLTSRGGYDNDKTQLQNPSALNYNIEACSHNGIKPDVQEKLARLMGVPEAKVRFEFCRRILTAYTRGAIPYEDYVQLYENHLMAPSVVRALGIARPNQSAPRNREQGDSTSRNREQGNAAPSNSGQGEIVLLASAKMDSGETFKGVTRASNGNGRFSLKSSRHSATCSGSYTLKDRRPTVTLPIKCSDGRTGQAEVTRTPDMMQARGKVKLSDGSTGRLAVGTTLN